MSNSDRQLLSFGVFLIIIVVGILLAVAGVISWGLFVPVVVVLYRLLGNSFRWLCRQVNRRSTNVEPSAQWLSGIGLIAFGAAWYLFGINWIYSLVVILLVIAALAIATALRRK